MIRKKIAIFTTIVFTSFLMHVERVPGEEIPPESVKIEALADLYSIVSFDHSLHVDLTACSTCHHHTVGTEIVNKNCTRCHTAGGDDGEAIFNSQQPDSIACRSCHEKERFSSKYLRMLDNPKLYHIDKPGLKGAYHLNCIGCHKEMEGPVGCQDCHTMTSRGEKLFNTGEFKTNRTPESKVHDH